MLGRFSHIGLVVRDLDATIDSFRSVLGARLVEREHFAATQTEVAIVDLNGTQIELLSSKAPDSKIGRVLAEKGEGIHHISFDVEGIERNMAAMDAAGVRLLDAAPRIGVHGRKVAFVDPAATSGIQFELVEEPPGRGRPADS